MNQFGFPIILAACLLATSAPMRWARVPANLSRVAYPPLMRLASFDVKLEFDADISFRRLVQVRNVKDGHKIFTNEWVQDNIPKILLGKSVEKTSGHFRLCLNLSDPRLEQQMPSQ